MSAQFYSSLYRFETDVLDGLMKNSDHRIISPEMYSKVIGIINGEVKLGRASRKLAYYIRLAVKLSPYSPEIAPLIKLHNTTLKAVAEATMPGLFETVRACQDKNLPLPIIVSCEKYLSKAMQLQKVFKERYFSITPIIVRGSPSLMDEHFQAPVLTLPVSDSYEALPVKIIETCAFLQAISERVGMIKIDDDMLLHPITPPTLEQARTAFAVADYSGLTVHSPFHDRTWHVGKCSQPVPHVYGKPVKTPWCRGALYYLSRHALEVLTQYSFRFPSCLDGEMYEDKAIADILYEHGIIATSSPLEPLLGIDSTSPERLHSA